MNKLLKNLPVIRNCAKKFFWFTFIILIILFCFQNRLWFENHSQNISIVANISQIIALIGVILAYTEYVNKRKDSKRHALLTLKSQLEVIGVWTDYKGTGYHKNKQVETIRQNEKVWGNPFSEVYQTDINALQNIWLNPGIAELPKSIIEKIAPLNQEILTFNNTVKTINLFRLGGDQNLKISIHMKLNGVIKKPLSKKEQYFSLKLQELYAGLHFDIIADDTAQRLHFKHRELLNLVEEEIERG